MAPFSGCAAPPGQGITTISPPAGPFRDIPAGVRAVASKHNLAVLGGFIDPDDPNKVIITLISVTDEPAQLRLHMPDGWRDARNPVMPLDMQMTIGRLGHPDREARFLRDLRNRLDIIANSPTASAPL